MALDSNTLASVIKTSLDKFKYSNSLKKLYYDVDDSGTYTPGVDVIIGDNPGETKQTEKFAEVIAASIVNHIKNEAVVTVNDVQAGSDNANGTIS